jgi:cytochrome P450
MEEHRRRGDDGFTLRLPGYAPIVVFGDPGAVETIFTASPSDLLAGRANQAFSPVLGRSSLLMLDGAVHQDMRRLIAAALGRDAVRRHQDAIVSQVRQAATEWPLGITTPVLPRLQVVVLDALLVVLLGNATERFRADLRARLVALLNLFTSTPSLVALWMLQHRLGPLTPWSRMMRRMRSVDELIYEELGRRRVKRTGGSLDVMDVLAELHTATGGPLADEAIRDQLVTLFVAGSETTTPAIAWTMWHIVRCAEVSARLNGTSTARTPSGEAYLDAVIKESLRLTPPIVTVGRWLRCPASIAERSLAAGTIAAPCAYLTQRSSELWDEPERFVPERFLEHRPSPYHYYPFGGGTRYCVGAELATYLTRVVLTELMAGLRFQPGAGYHALPARRGTSIVPSRGLLLAAERVTR